MAINDKKKKIWTQKDSNHVLIKVKKLSYSSYN